MGNVIGALLGITIGLVLLNYFVKDNFYLLPKTEWVCTNAEDMYNDPTKVDCYILVKHKR